MSASLNTPPWESIGLYVLGKSGGGELELREGVLSLVVLCGRRGDLRIEGSEGDEPDGGSKEC